MTEATAHVIGHCPRNLAGGATLRRLCLMLTFACLSEAARGGAPRPAMVRVRVEDDRSRERSYVLSLSISGDGRFVAFQSQASDLVRGDTNGTFDVFVYGRVTRKMERSSVDSEGNQSSRGSARPRISSDGRFVVFQSWGGLAAGTGNMRDAVFLRDRREGRTVLVGEAVGKGRGRVSCTQPSVSRDGSVVAFTGRWGRFDPQDPWHEVFVSDMATGRTERIAKSTIRNGTFEDGPLLSADGRFMVFCAPGRARGGGEAVRQVFLHDWQKGSTKLASMSPAGDEANGDCVTPSVSADGRFTAFFSHATNLGVGRSNGRSGIFVHDRLTGRTERVGVDHWKGERRGASERPSISGDGRFVAFESKATALLGRRVVVSRSIFVWDRATGRVAEVSTGVGGEAADGDSTRPAISGDGRYITFCSDASNLVPGDTNGSRDIFIAANPLSRGRR